MYVSHVVKIHCINYRKNIMSIKNHRIREMFFLMNIIGINGSRHSPILSNNGKAALAVAEALIEN